MKTILIIDDFEMERTQLKEFLEKEGLFVETAERADEGWKKFVATHPFLVLLDQILPDGKGIEILKRMKEYDSNVNIMIITAFGNIKDAVKAMELGAINYLIKPVDLQELKILINQAIHLSSLIKERDHHRKKLQVQVKGRWTPLLFDSLIMAEVFKRCQEVANTNTTILLLGESGSGKGLFAHYIHQTGNRAEAPFIDVDCSTIPETLLESELFGYEPGAFTDAKERKEGLIELANSGTLFLDEISGLPITLQGKLLKVIEEKSFRKLGGQKEIEVDTRVIVATNTNLKEAVAKGKFREDLYFRISTFIIELPPLRQRKEDIPALAKHFFNEIRNELHKDVDDINTAALDALVRYNWPGNIRELRNTIERAILVAKNKKITIENLGIEFNVVDNNRDHRDLRYKEAKRQFESGILEKALSQTRGNQSQAAKILGISRNALIRRIAQFHIDLSKFKKNNSF